MPSPVNSWGHSPMTRTLQSIPVAKGLPVLGNVTFDSPLWLVDQYHKLGPVFWMSILQHRMIVLAGPEANLLMREEGDTLFTSRDTWKNVLEAFGSDNPFMLARDGPDHATLRAGLKVGYAGSTLYPQMPKLMDSLVRLMMRWPRHQAMSVTPLVKRLVSLLLAYMAINQEPDEVMDDLIYLFRAVIKIHLTRTRPGFMKYMPQYLTSQRNVLAMGKRIWNEHLMHDMAEEGGNFIDHVRRFQAEHPDLMTENDAIATIQTPFLAGMDTAAGSLSFLLYHILRDPALREMVIAEADQLFADGVPTRASLHRMRQTRWIAMESLRMHPIAMTLPRTSICDFEFQGHHIPAGTRCLIAISVTHHLSEFFPEPLRFDIERYAPPRMEHTQTHAYVPYGIGSHACLGASTADLLFLLVTAALFHHLEVEMSPPDHVLNVIRNPLTCPDDSFRMIVTGERRASQ